MWVYSLTIIKFTLGTSSLLIKLPLKFIILILLISPDVVLSKQEHIILSYVYIFLFLLLWLLLTRITIITLNVCGYSLCLSGRLWKIMLLLEERQTNIVHVRFIRLYPLLLFNYGWNSMICPRTILIFKLFFDHLHHLRIMRCLLTFLIVLWMITMLHPTMTFITFHPCLTTWFFYRF